MTPFRLRGLTDNVSWEQHKKTLKPGLVLTLILKPGKGMLL